MPNLFGIDIQGIVNQNLGPGFPDAVLRPKTVGTRTTGQLTAGTNPDDGSVQCKAILSDYSAYEMMNTLVQMGDRKALILGGSLGSTVPKPGDTLTAEAQDFRIIQVTRDPAAATYTCQVRA